VKVIYSFAYRATTNSKTITLTMKKAEDKQQDPKPASERVESYVKHKNGAIFLVTENTRNVDLVYLISKKNKSHSFTKKNIRQGMIDGEWLNVNEHEVRSWDEVYTENVIRLTRKILKHVIVAELMIEIDDDLQAEEMGDKYFKNLLHKTNKQAMRIADKHFDNLYKVDPVMLQNMLRVIESMTKKIAELPLEDYPYLDKHVEKFFEDPKAFRDVEVEFVKPQ
jgi:hypothetical protein